MIAMLGQIDWNGLASERTGQLGADPFSAGLEHAQPLAKDECHLPVEHDVLFVAGPALAGAMNRPRQLHRKARAVVGAAPSARSDRLEGADADRCAPPELLPADVARGAADADSNL